MASKSSIEIVIKYLQRSYFYTIQYIDCKEK